MRITVEDRGKGIPAGELAHVFEPFFRGRGALEAQVQGFGLGLALVDRIAREHGGRVSVASRPGGGSAFTLHLPASPPVHPDAARTGLQVRGLARAQFPS